MWQVRGMDRYFWFCYQTEKQPPRNVEGFCWFSHDCTLKNHYWHRILSVWAGESRYHYILQIKHISILPFSFNFVQIKQNYYCSETRNYQMRSQNSHYPIIKSLDIQYSSETSCNSRAALMTKSLSSLVYLAILNLIFHIFPQHMWQSDGNCLDFCPL